VKNVHVDITALAKQGVPVAGMVNKRPSLFRDWLRSDRTDRERYAGAKRRLARATEGKGRSLGLG
jgi:GrpB-like predicted nucleotidyltransferase (UPF0157 family)